MWNLFPTFPHDSLLASVLATVLLDSSDSSVDDVQVEELVVVETVLRLEDVVVTEMLLLVLVVETSNSWLLKSRNQSYFPMKPSIFPWVSGKP